MTSPSEGRSRTAEVTITQIVDLRYRPEAFTPGFMAEFRRHFYDFSTVGEHLEFLARQIAYGTVTDEDTFLEGYGRVGDYLEGWEESEPMTDVGEL